MAYKILELSAIQKIKTWVINKLSTKANNSDLPSQATENISGIIKLNPDQSIDLNLSGQLVVGGRLGQYPDGGVYFPVDIDPSGVGASSFLMSDGAKNLSIVARTFAILAGCGITCKSAAAGSTQYRISNTQANRFACRAIVGGRLALSNQDAIDNGTAEIVSIKFANGNDISAYFGATESNNDIIITTNRSVNPSAATTTLRGYGTNGSNDNILVGQGVGGSHGKGISLGQSTFIGGNQTMALGNSVHIMANNSVGFGSQIRVDKQFCFATGQGHELANCGNGTSAVGIYSQVNANTKFAVGNGTAYNSRSNIFEVIDDNGATGLVVKAPNGTRYRISVNNNGNLTTTAI